MNPVSLAPPQFVSAASQPPTQVVYLPNKDADAHIFHSNNNSNNNFVQIAREEAPYTGREMRYVIREDEDDEGERKEEIKKEYVIFKYAGTTTSPPTLRKGDVVWRQISTKTFNEEQIRKGDAPEIPTARRLVNGKPVKH